MRGGLLGFCYVNAGMTWTSTPRLPARPMKSPLRSVGRVPTRPGTRTPQRSGPGPGRGPEGYAPRPPTPGKTVERRSDPGVVAWRPQRNPYMTRAAGGLVAGVIIAFLLVSIFGGNGGNGSHEEPAAEGTYRLPAAVLSKLDNVPVSALVGNAVAANVNQVTPPTTLPPNAPRISSNGRPEIIYIGAQFCASCAGERWALVIASVEVWHLQEPKRDDIVRYLPGRANVLLLWCHVHEQVPELRDGRTDPQVRRPIDRFLRERAHP